MTHLKIRDNEYMELQYHFHIRIYSLNRNNSSFTVLKIKDTDRIKSTYLDFKVIIGSL
jgi:hypothetical protein